ncbi:MAG: rRNA maturation RNase YbeY [Alphaproteobacteria bacterium]|nr:MAG: rRNA maturation RNase YbeY [Alphaproteobacteria bacterium]
MFIEIKPLPTYTKNWYITTSYIPEHLQPASVYIVKKAISFSKYMYNQTVFLNINCINLKYMKFLNKKYKNKDKATNVLSFPADTIPANVSCTRILGDVFICTNFLRREVDKANFNSHFLHMVLHGTLHLLGYDHETQQDAVIMQNIEKKVLFSFNLSDPYETKKNHINL